MTNWYEVKNIDELDSPALIVFPDRIQNNIRLAIEMVGNIDRLRPHVKTHKSKEVSQLMMQAGIKKFKCATIAEVEMLAQCMAPDVLLAYQPLGPKLKRFISLIKKYPATKFSCLTDNIAAANEQASAFNDENLSIPVFIDLNVGMNRTGIAPDEKAIALYKYCSSLKGITVAGLHAYDGHLRDSAIALRKQNCDAGFITVEKMKEQLQKGGFVVPVIIAGGSPAFPIHAERKEVECSPGTFVYWDKGYSDLCPEQKFLPAAVLVTRVISLPTENKICLDLGHKSVSAENEIEKRVYFLNAADMKLVSQSEEHLVVETVSVHAFKPGDVLYGLPFHICPTVALYDSLWIVNRADIDSFKVNFLLGNVTSGSYPVPQVILDWPAQGTGNNAHSLAPYFDYNTDGIFDPMDGDYPLIDGDQELFWIFNCRIWICR